MEPIELEITSGSALGQRVRVADKKVTFGRTDASNIVLGWDKLTSALHFQVHTDGTNYFLVDLGSTNGTYINGRRVGSQQLAPGDEILAGKTTFRVHMQGAVASPKSDSDSSVKPFNPFDAFHPGLKKPPAPVDRGGTVSPGDVDADDSPRIAQVRLRITSSLEKDTVFWLSAGQTLTFGRTANSDCSLSFDPTLSGRHFRVTCETDQCQVEDLQSRRGTWINGARVSQANLYHGDRLQAGGIHFVIEVEGAGGALLANTSPAPQAGFTPTVASAGATLKATRWPCPSGLTRLRGALSDDFSAADLIGRLAGSGTLYLLIDFSRFGDCLPEVLAPKASALFPWIPREAAVHSPQVVALEEIPEWASYIEEGWGSDAIVALRSGKDQSEFVSAMRQLAHGPGKAIDNGRGVNGFCWPSVLSALLENDADNLTQPIMQQADLILTEVLDAADGWQMYGSPKSIEACSSLGFEITLEASPERDAVPEAVV